MLLKPQWNKIGAWDGDRVVSKRYWLVRIIITSLALMPSSCNTTTWYRKAPLHLAHKCIFCCCSNHLFCVFVAGSFLSLGRVLANSSSRIAATSLYIRSNVNASTYPEFISCCGRADGIKRKNMCDPYGMVVQFWRPTFLLPLRGVWWATRDNIRSVIPRAFKRTANLSGCFPMIRPFFARQVVIFDC